LADRSVKDAFAKEADVPMVRVLLGGLPTSLHRAVSGAIRSQIDIEVVGVAIQPTALLLAAGELRPDVVVVGMVGGGLPGIASHLLDQYPHITVLAIAPDGRQGLIYALRPQVERIDTSSTAELLRTIRAAGRPRPD
jgi:DNA-binding NarL/FixJ family response regulator